MMFSGRLGAGVAGACACAMGANVATARNNLSAQAILLKSSVTQAGRRMTFRTDV
jgi:hypothetical protein